MLTTLVYRAMGAAALDPSAYEDVEKDRPATAQALAVVVLSSVAAGIGAAGYEAPRLTTILTVTTIALATWLAWAGLILYVGGRIFPERQTQVDFGQLVRTIGFAAAPGLLQLLGLLTSVRLYAFAIAWIWMLIAMVVAIRQALDYRTLWHAAGVCVVALCIAASTTLLVAMALTMSVS